ncbi:BBP7 family outer membrane beta-barrel protein [Pirellulaceae bacterium SH449]
MSWVLPAFNYKPTLQRSSLRRRHLGWVTSLLGNALVLLVSAVLASTSVLFGVGLHAQDATSSSSGSQVPRPRIGHSTVGPAYGTASEAEMFANSSVAPMESTHFDHFDTVQPFSTSTAYRPFRSAVGWCGSVCDRDFFSTFLSAAPGDRWLRVEYLYWGVSTPNQIPLVAASVPGTAPENTGVLGLPTTSILAPTDDSFRGLSGFRIAKGWWLECADIGFELSYTGLPRSEMRNEFRAPSDTHLARPVIDAITGQEISMLVNHPNVLNGSVRVTSDAEFHIADFIARTRAIGDESASVSRLFGFRYARLEEGLRIDQSSDYPAARGPIIAGTQVELHDQFRTRNRFVGAVMGFDATQRFRRWSLDFQGMISVGNTQSYVDIQGQTVTSVPNAGSALFRGGLLAQETNIGKVVRDRFSVIPEFTVSAKVPFRCMWEASVGYHFLFWSGAAQPGNQIDRAVSQFPPEPTAGRSPQALFDTSGAIIQGLQLGLERRF